MNEQEKAALDDRRQRAREAWHDEFETPGTLAERGARAVEAAIETATRVKITPEILRSASKGWPVIDEIVKAAFRAAGFEVEQ